MGRNSTTATVNTTEIIDRRTARAAKLIEKHLSHREANVIKARVCATGRNVFEVKGSAGETHTVSIKELGAAFDSCDCKGWHHYHYCSHVDSIKAMYGIETPLGGGEWQPAGGWSSQTKRPRTEMTEEV